MREAVRVSFGPMKAVKHSPTEEGSGLQEIVQAACAVESRQWLVAMDQHDLRVQETVAQLIFIAGNDLRPSLRAD